MTGRGVAGGDDGAAGGVESDGTAGAGPASGEPGIAGDAEDPGAVADGGSDGAEAEGVDGEVGSAGRGTVWQADSSTASDRKNARIMG